MSIIEYLPPQSVIDQREKDRQERIRQAEERRRQQKEREINSAKTALVNILNGHLLSENIDNFVRLSWDSQDYALRWCEFNPPLSNFLNLLDAHQSNRVVCQRIRTYYLIKTFDTSLPLQTSNLRDLWTIGMSSNEVMDDFRYHPDFIARMELFLSKLASSTTVLTDEETACLHAIFTYSYHPKNSKPLHHHFISQLLLYAKMRPIKETYTIFSSFSFRMKNIIRNGFLPYTYLMNPETLLDIQTTRNMKPILDFTMKYIRLLPPSEATVGVNPIYAPKGIITPQGVNQYLSHIFNWLLVFQEAIPSFKFKLTAGITPTNRSTEQDKAYWPSIIENLFNAILASRELILDAIQQRDPFHRVSIDNVELLINRLTWIENNPDDMMIGVDPRVITGFKETLFSPNLSLGCHLIFDAIASTITNELIRRTRSKRKEELSHYHSFDDELGKQTTIFNQEVFNYVYAHIQYLVCHSFIHQNVNFSAVDLMFFIETTHEHRLNLLSASAMEAPQKNALYPLMENIPYNQPHHYNQVAFHLDPENRNKKTREFVLCIASKKVATIKEMLLFVLFFNSLPEENGDKFYLQNQFPRLMHQFFFIRELQIQANSFECSSQEREETLFYIKQVLDSIIKIDRLFDAYLCYFLERVAIPIHPEEAGFLLSNLDKVKSLLYLKDIQPAIFLPRIIPFLPKPQYSQTSLFTLFHTAPSAAKNTSILSHEEMKAYCIDQLTTLHRELEQQSQGWLSALVGKKAVIESINTIQSLKISVELSEDIFELYQAIDESYRSADPHWDKLIESLQICMEKTQISVHGYGRGIQV